MRKTLSSQLIAGVSHGHSKGGKMPRSNRDSVYAWSVNQPPTTNNETKNLPLGQNIFHYHTACLSPTGWSARARTHTNNNRVFIDLALTRLCCCAARARVGESGGFVCMPAHSHTSCRRRRRPLLTTNASHNAEFSGEFVKRTFLTLSSSMVDDCCFFLLVFWQLQCRKKTLLVVSVE